MNKAGIISFILTLLLLLALYIPYGFIFGSFINYNNNRIFMLGIIFDDGSARFWLGYNLLSFLFLTILPISLLISVLIGSIIDSEKSRKLVMYNLNGLIIVIIYVIIGISIYSEEIFGAQILLDIIFFIDYGIVVFAIDIIFAAIAFVTRPHESKY